MGAMTLLKDTFRLLTKADPHQDRAVLREIAAGVGKPVELDWLRKFRNGDIADPGVSKIEALHNYLKARHNA